MTHPCHCPDTFLSYTRYHPRVPTRRMVEDAWSDFPAASAPPAWLMEMTDEGRERTVRLPSAGTLLQMRARGELARPALLPRGRR